MAIRSTLCLASVLVSSAYGARSLFDTEVSLGRLSGVVSELKLGGEHYAPSARNAVGVQRSRHVRRASGDYDFHWVEIGDKRVVGDVVLHDELFEALVTDDPDAELLGLITSATINAWPCPVPYAIESGFWAPAQVTAALQEIERLTNWQFVPRTTEADYLYFVSEANNGCASYIGRILGQQKVWIEANRCGFGSTVHEVLHALGVWHEQSRSDRDMHVSINFTNVVTAALSNFDTSPTYTNLVGNYDWDSIMHYGAYDFAVNSNIPVITPASGVLPASVCHMGQRDTMSQGDVAAAMQRWSSSATCGTSSTPPTYSKCGSGDVYMCGWPFASNQVVNGRYELTSLLGKYNLPIWKRWQVGLYLYVHPTADLWVVGQTLNGTAGLVAASFNSVSTGPHASTDWRVFYNGAFTFNSGINWQSC